MSGETLLVISGEGVQPFSARGIKEKLEPINQAQKNVRRDANGTLRKVGGTQFLKYKCTLTGDDVLPPAFDALEVGDTITVDCVSYLSYKTSGGSPARTVVSGSSRTSGIHTLYRPQITFIIMNKSQETDEYGAEVTWTLELEEV
jgi:hypothetical protein